MELNNQFHVNVDIERAWAVLTDVEMIAPCMPGAELREVDGNQYFGVVKIKVGPISAQYGGNAEFVEKNDDTKTAILKGAGRDSKGQGNATILVSMSLTSSPDGSGTDVSIRNEIQITGKVAQFARASVVAEIANKLLSQFVDCLENGVFAPQAKLDETQSSTAQSEPESPLPLVTNESEPEPQSSTSEPQEPPTVRKIEYAQAKPIDLLETAATPVLKRVVPIAALAAVAIWAIRRFLK